MTVFSYFFLNRIAFLQFFQTYVKFGRCDWIYCNAHRRSMAFPWVGLSIVGLSMNPEDEGFPTTQSLVHHISKLFDLSYWDLNN